jgi:glycosyltransferase involved in cell wall biosynthesis
MNDYIVGQLLELITLGVLSICFVLIIAASFYDIWITRRRKVIVLQTKRLQRNRPHVTVIVYAKNSASFVSDCLSSILRNRYRQYDIVVVNNHSTDQTKATLAQFKRDHGAARLSIYNKRKDGTEHASLQQAYRKSKRGDIVLSIRSDSILSKAFIKEAVAHFHAFGSSKNDTVLLFNERPSSPQSIVATLRYFQQSSRQFVRKSTALLVAGRPPRKNSILTIAHNAMYKRAVLMDKKRMVQTRYVYDSQLSVGINVLSRLLLVPKKTLKQSLLFYVTGISLVAYVVYGIYMAATFENTTIFLLGWCVVVIWFLVVIWSDDASRLSDKFRYSFMLPSLYFFLTVLIVIEVIIRGFRQLIIALRMTSRGIVLYYKSQPAPLFE